MSAHQTQPVTTDEGVVYYTMITECKLIVRKWAGHEGNRQGSGQGSEVASFY